MEIDRQSMRFLITGITGQDGAYLADLLIQGGHEVFGGIRKSSSDNFWRLDHLDLTNKINFFSYEIGSDTSLVPIIDENNIDFIFHLAGNSFTIDSIDFPVSTIRTNTLGCIEVLEAIRTSRRRPGVFLANSSEIYGNSFLLEEERCDESTVPSPMNPYGFSHHFNLQIADYYRRNYSMEIWVGIFFNHESPLRTSRFLTRKLSKGFIALKNGVAGVIELGNLNSFRDFGFAPVFMSAAIDLIKNSPPGNFIFSGGAYHSVREVVSFFAKGVGFDPVFVGEGLNEKCVDVKSGRVLASISSKFYRHIESRGSRGDPKKLEQLLQRSLHTPFEEISGKMLDYDSRLFRK